MPDRVPALWAPYLLAQGSLLSGLSLVGTGLLLLAEARRPQKQCKLYLEEAFKVNSLLHL